MKDMREWGEEVERESRGNQEVMTKNWAIWISEKCKKKIKNKGQIEIGKSF